MALSTKELLLQAEALGFSTATDEQNKLTIFLEGETRWKLIFYSDEEPVPGTVPCWVLIVNGSPQISFYPEDVIRFLRTQRRDSRS